MDNYSREGIVVAEEMRPGPTWLHAQEDARLRELAQNEVWLGVVPFTGGYVISAKSLSKWLRAANEEDLRRALESANLAAARSLAEALPDLASKILRKTKK